MNRTEFSSELEARLTGLPEEEIKRQLQYYAELIDDRMEEGMGEEEAVAALGAPGEIAETVFGELPILARVRAAKPRSTGRKVLNILLLVLGSPIWLSLLVALVAVILAVVVSLWAAVLGLGAGALGAGLGGLVIAARGVVTLVSAYPVSIFVLGGGMAAVGVGILLGFTTFYGGRALLRLSVVCTRKLKKWIFGRR